MLIVYFILGALNLILGGMLLSMIFIKRTDGKIVELTDYISVAITVSMGLYMLVCLIGAAQG